MGTIELYGKVFHGVHYGNVCLYTHETGHSYDGEHEAGMAHGHGVLKYSNGITSSAQFANGLLHGHSEARWYDGDVYDGLYEHGNRVHCAHVDANGACEYDKEPCGADHAGHVAVKAAAQQAGVRNTPLPASAHPRPRAPAPCRNRNVCCSRARSIFVPASARGSLRVRTFPCAHAGICVCARARACARACVRVSFCVCVCLRAIVCVCIGVCVSVWVGARARACEAL
jgi:hypothetical protein